MRPQGGSLRVRRRRFPQGSLQDEVVLEEALHLTLLEEGGELPWASLLRTPGHDFELALGYLYGLELIEQAHQITQISYCSSPQNYNRLRLLFREGIPEAARRRRSVDWVHSGCGACGQEELSTTTAAPVAPSPRVTINWLSQLPDRLRQGQKLFSRTGGSHAAGWFEADSRHPLAIFEDVGRHNAVDKLVGWRLMQGGLPASGSWLVLSGRAGFELIQKALRAGFSGVASVGPPSSLAISMANQAGLCLVGFLRSDSLSCYSRPNLISGLEAD